ncbi:MAG: hypothetical protein ACI8PZ_000821, partial [Myxococcota bacterium]
MRHALLVFWLVACGANGDKGPSDTAAETSAPTPSTGTGTASGATGGAGSGTGGTGTTATTGTGSTGSGTGGSGTTGTATGSTSTGTGGTTTGGSATGGTGTDTGVSDTGTPPPDPMFTLDLGLEVVCAEPSRRLPAPFDTEALADVDVLHPYHWGGGVSVLDLDGDGTVELIRTTETGILLYERGPSGWT